jgi:hypothetical protein
MTKGVKMSHCVQLIFVEAENHQDAIDEVGSRLDEADWSDWSEVGGRWSGLFGESEPDAILYSNDPEKWNEVIKTFSEYRAAHMKEALSYLKGKENISDLIDKYKPTVNNFPLGMDGYYLRRIGSIIADYWTHDSAMYDLEAGTSNLAYLAERIEKDPKKQFMVAVDFHY